MEVEIVDSWNLAQTWFRTFVLNIWSVDSFLQTGFQTTIPGTMQLIDRICWPNDLTEKKDTPKTRVEITFTNVTRKDTAQDVVLNDYLFLGDIVNGLYSADLLTKQ